MLKNFVLAVAGMLILAAPTQASSSTFLSKERAKAKTSSVAGSLCNDIDECETWGVESSYECARRTSHVVDCDYALWFFNGVRCDSKMRVRLVGSLTHVSFPNEPNCVEA